MKAVAGLLIFPLLPLWLAAAPIEPARPRSAPACEALLRSDAGTPAASDGLLLLSRCREDAGQRDLAIEAAERALALEAVATRAEYPLSVLEPVARRLDELRVEIEVPPPGTCGELRAAPGCSRTFLACTHELGGVDRASEVAYGRLVVTVAHTPRESRTLDDDGKSPTWGQPLRLVRPWQCQWHESWPRLTAEKDDHTTLVLESRVERTCTPEHVGCRLDATDAGPGWLASVDCRLVVADACRELVGTVCVARTADRTQQQITLKRVVRPR